MLSETQIERYSRQIRLPQVGGRGQEKLLAAAVAVLGNDEVASTAAVYLAAAGVGRLARDAAPHTAVSCVSTREDVNPDSRTITLPARLTVGTAAEIARRSDVVVAGGLAHDMCVLLNVACVAQRTPLVWGRAQGIVGELTTLAGHWADAPCYGCLCGGPAWQLPTSAGVAELAGVTAAFVGSLLATEVIKIVTGVDPLLTGRLLRYDALDSTLREVAVAKDPSCTTCSAASESVISQ